MSATGLFTDSLIILLYFCLIVGLGLYMGRREASLKDFALGGRRVPWWAVMASIIAAETSAATYLGAPGEGFQKQSFAYVQLVFGLILGRIIVGYVFLKPYYRYKVYTVYDYLAIRFGNVSKNYVSFLFLVMRTLASGSRLFVPSLVIVLAWRLLVHGQQVTFNEKAVETLWPYIWAIGGITLVTFIYTAAGGIKAVIWTDLIQASLMYGTAVIAAITLLYHVGGNSWNLADGFRAAARAVPQLTHRAGYMITGFEKPRIDAWMQTHHIHSMSLWEYFKMIFLSEYTVFSALIGGTVANIAAFGTDQDMVQRLLTAETYKKSRRSLILAALMDLPIGLTFTFIGILLYVYYQQDPTYKPEGSSDVFGSYILNVMPVGIRGLVLAGVFATAMGSLSTALNALATSATNDWYIPYFARNRDDSHHVAAARIFTGIFAILMIATAVVFAFFKIHNPEVRIIPVVLGIAGFILGPMLGVFLLGMLTRSRGNDFGNMIGVSLGLIVTIILGGLHVDFAQAIAPGSAATQWLADFQARYIPTVAFTWYPLVGMIVVLAVGIFFKTPDSALENAQRRAEEAQHEDDTPLSLRN